MIPENCHLGEEKGGFPVQMRVTLYYIRPEKMEDGRRIFRTL
jgi:hypothetical protein